MLVAALAVTIAGIDQCAAERSAQGCSSSAGLECDPRQYQVAISASVARFHPAPRKKAKRIREITKMKNWDTQKTSLAERFADGRRYASGKTAEAVDLSNFCKRWFGLATASVWKATTRNKRTFSPLRSPTSIPPRSMIFT